MKRDGVKLGGVFEMVCFGKDGEEKWREIAENIITSEGLDRILDVVLHGTTAIDPWYVIPVETNTAPAAGLTYAVPTFTESAAYTEGVRQEYVEAAASSGSTTNSANKAAFSINATKTIYGAALVGGGSAATTKSDTAGGGTLLCYAILTASRAVVSGDTLNVTYTISADDDGTP